MGIYTSSELANLIYISLAILIVPAIVMYFVSLWADHKHKVELQKRISVISSLTATKSESESDKGRESAA